MHKKFLTLSATAVAAAIALAGCVVHRIGDRGDWRRGGTEPVVLGISPVHHPAGSHRLHWLQLSPSFRPRPSARSIWGRCDGPLLRAVHRRRHLRRALADGPAVARARRQPRTVWDVAFWAIIFGIIGGRLYHVITDPEMYFGSGRQPDRCPQDLGRRARHLGRRRPGRLGAWIGCRRTASSLTAFADAAAPGVAVRPGHRPVGQLVQQRAVRRPDEPAVEAADPPTGHRPPGQPRRMPSGAPVVLGVLPADVPIRVVCGA